MELPYIIKYSLSLMDIKILAEIKGEPLFKDNSEGHLFNHDTMIGPYYIKINVYIVDCLN